jgi:glycine dehydrogenase subunit 1
MDLPTRAHPYMPNSTPEARKALLGELGISSTEDLFAQIPEQHRLRTGTGLPPPITSEASLRRHLRSILTKNRSCEDNLNFLGGGCWQHHVPAVCDEIARRSEFLTPVWGTPSSDHGRNQAWFEFTSQLGELVGMEMVGLPVYSWGCAAGHAIRMGQRITGRNRVLVPAMLSPQRRSVVENYCASARGSARIHIVEVATSLETGRVEQADLEAKLGPDVAAVYVENPSYLGMIEAGIQEIARSARTAGAETIVGVDPISLGVLEAPGLYGADIVVGSTQPLGVHMYGGGGLGGFIASRDELAYAHEYPTLMLSIAETVKGEHAFGMMLMHQSSYGSREEGKDWTGNSTYLWAVASAVYMSLLGPQGFRELGELIVSRAHYAARLLSGIANVRLPYSTGFFKEFIVNFDATGKSVAEVNAGLLERGIFGGLDLSRDFPELGQAALYCVTEVHSADDLERLAGAVQEVCAR